MDAAEKYGLRKHARFSQDVTKFVWNEDKATWTLTVFESDGLENLGKQLPDEEFDIVLNYRKGAFFPYIPDIPGAKDATFRGEMFHSMDWPVGGLAKLKGKNVAMIGLAAAGVQIAPVVAKHCKSLTIFSRTPNYVHPKPNDPWTEEQKQLWAKDPVRYRLDCAKFSTEFFERWEGAMLHPGSETAKREAKACLDHLEQNVQDPELRKILTPNYPPWARRMLFTNEFYPTLGLPNVELVDEKILKIEPTAIVSSTQSGRLGLNSGVGLHVVAEADPNAKEKRRDIDVVIWA